MDVSFTGADDIDIDLTSAFGTHIDLLSTNVENYEIEGLEGDDMIDFIGAVLASGSVTVYGGGPGRERHGPHRLERLPPSTSTSSRTT